MVSARETNANGVWGPDWPAIRDRWDPDRSRRNLNHGAFGGAATEVVEAQAELHRHIHRNTTRFFAKELDPGLEVARQRAAAFVGAAPDHFALVRNASAGTTVVANSLRLRAGDEILTTDQNFATVRHAMGAAAARAGAVVMQVHVPVTHDDESVVDAIRAGITARTRLLVVDAISSPLSMVFPVNEIVAMAHDHGVAVFVDGAHAPGNLPIDLAQTRPDYWVGDFHKWLGAPHGVAGLYVDGDTSLIAPLIQGSGARRGFPDSMAREGIDDYTGMLLVPAALDVIEELGGERLRQHNTTLAAMGGRLIASALRTTPIPCRFAGFHSVRLPRGVAETPTQAAALQDDIDTRLATDVTVAPGLLRLSAWADNSPGQYDAFAHELRGLLDL